MVRVSACPTPANSGRKALLDHLKCVLTTCLDWSASQDRVVGAIGIATAGWVDYTNGSVAYATDNLPGWTGTRIAAEVGAITRLPIGVENDANALAVGERYFGLGRGVRNFICITLGTGIGAGCYVAGRLNRGAHFFANALGHVPLEVDGLQCTCGKRGCLEVYANAAALTHYAGGRRSPEEVVRAANEGEQEAIRAIQRLGHYLARGCASAVQLLDPELLILSGGLAENNPHLVESLEAELAGIVSAWEQRKLRIRRSPLGYYGGVAGAAAVALERWLE
jgi:predicted NBD/HSP70 family sugar kinase